MITGKFTHREQLHQMVLGTGISAAGKAEFVIDVFRFEDPTTRVLIGQYHFPSFEQGREKFASIYRWNTGLRPKMPTTYDYINDVIITRRSAHI